MDIVSVVIFVILGFTACAEFGRYSQRYHQRTHADAPAARR